MTKSAYEIKQIVPETWNKNSDGTYSKYYGVTKELDSFDAVKKFLLTKNTFTTGKGSDVFKNGELMFHTSNFDNVKTTENKPLTLKNVIEDYKEWGE